MKLAYILLPVMLFVSSCGSLKSKVKAIDTIDKKLEQKQKVLDRQARVYLEGAINVVKSKPKLEEADKLVLRLLGNTQSIIGNPLESEKIGVNAVLAREPEATKKLMVLESNTNTLIAEKLKLEEDKKEAEKALRAKAEHIIATEKSWFEKLKDKFTQAMTFMIIGAVLLMFGPQLLKLIGKIIKPI